MPSTLVLDRSDPGVNELVSTWKDGGSYQITLNIVQKTSGPNTAHYDVTGIEAEEMEPEEEMPMKKKMPMNPPPAAVQY